MQTVEVVVYIGVAIIIGGLIIMFIAGINPNKMYDKIQKVFTGEKTLKYDKITSDELAITAYKVWEDCGFGAQNSSLTVYVEDSNSTTIADLFKTYVKLNLCYSIHSESNNCGSEEDVVLYPEPLTGPAVVTISCNPITQQLEIKKL